uniref:Uncharacterized protein n=1 Tax=Glossina palpalis gambiensis TaxID=67801 RepID=A0A1B0B9L2_9MUSC
MPSRFSVPRQAPFFTKTLQIGACPRINANNKGVFPSISGAFNGYLGIDSMNNSQIAAAVLSSTTRHSSCKGFRPFKFAASALILDSLHAKEFYSRHLKSLHSLRAQSMSVRLLSTPTDSTNATVTPCLVILRHLLHSAPVAVVNPDHIDYVSEIWRTTLYFRRLHDVVAFVDILQDPAPNNPYLHHVALTLEPHPRIPIRAQSKVADRPYYSVRLMQHHACVVFSDYQRFVSNTKLMFEYILNRAFADQVYAIRCFKCLVTEEVSFANEEENLPNITPACSKFDSSSKFIVDCPYSTMCMKTISTMYLQYGLEQNTITRGCAPQKSSTLVFRNGNWHKEDSVKDVYVEECRLINENVLAASVVAIFGFGLHAYFHFDLHTFASFSTKHKNTTSSRCKRTAACNGYFVLLFNILNSKGPDICSNKSEHKIARLPTILRNVHTTPKVQADEINVPPAIGSKPNDRFEGPQDLYISTEATPKQYPLPYRSNQRPYKDATVMAKRDTKLLHSPRASLSVEATALLYFRSKSA